MAVAVELRGVRVRYGLLEALHGVDLACPAGRVTVLLGRNGSGRTTVLRALAGDVPVSAGQVLWEGRDVTELDAHRRAGAGLAYVPAGRGVFGSLTVAQNLALSGDGRVDRYFPELAGLLHRRAGTLSGGEQQMVAVGRALAAGPRVLLLDEPGRGLAPAVVARLHGALFELAAAGPAVVLAEQAPLPSLRRAAVVHVLRRGRVAFSGEPSELGAAGSTGGPGGADGTDGPWPV
ncbi:ATP-binding cassette domain-containing protein [Kitasatospora sp. NBC_00240]|uniref:ABC transporter ATP-binding protein n=1 Tax=Kitasatospora sp. NBC_00240 TaxID=2903567 RepID=UPI00224C9624|nr:ATP-binding cassette domain-containing protein [Kitasatospora sp. NBC_00240]MCX5208076.1 ATP-binding cassette domain-containing protein [Kitasatospora sp. NBC_00240]